MYWIYAIIIVLHYLEIVESTEYIILIDAGSSGSRVHVHSYQRIGDIPKIEPSLSLKVKPGLSSYEHNPEQAGSSLVQLIEFAQKKVPKDLWPKTPVYLQATAGLRSIPLSAAEAVLDSCRMTLRKYQFRFNPSYAVIISGQQEGINGWIAANYLRGAFSQPTPLTVGVIEMGGASMQLTFAEQLAEPNSQNKDLCGQHELIDLNVGSHKFRLYTHSYLDYGLEMVQLLFERHHSEVLKKEGNPCYPLAQLSRSGIGDYDKCSNLIEALFKKDNCSCSCSFNGVFQPSFTGATFYAIENFFYTSRFFGLDSTKDFALRLPDLGEAFCATHWDELLRKYPNETVADLEKYCFSSAYIPAMLSYGLGFQQLQLQDNVEPARIVGGTAIDWALGAVFLSILHGGAVDTKLVDGVLRVTTEAQTSAFTATATVSQYTLILVMVFTTCVALLFFLSKNGRNNDICPNANLALRKKDKQISFLSYLSPLIPLLSSPSMSPQPPLSSPLSASQRRFSGTTFVNVLGENGTTTRTNNSGFAEA